MFENQRDGSGLEYRRNRYYEPKVGRFTQEAPIGLAGGLNLYGFANGDPVNFADPFGLFDVRFDTPETEKAVRAAAATSPMLKRALTALENDHSIVLDISTGPILPGEGFPSYGVNNLDFNTSPDGKRYGKTRFDSNMINVFGPAQNVNFDDTVGHELYGHAEPWLRGQACTDDGGASSCAYKREAVIRREMKRPPEKP